MKTGVGPFGSPVGAPVSISAEFNLLRKRSPVLFLSFKPQIGDFANKPTIVSDINFPSQSPLAIARDSDSKSEGILSNSDEEETSWIGMLSEGVATPKSLVDQGKMFARTVVPVRDTAVVNLRWAAATSSAAEGDDWFRKRPYLVLNKIGIEQVERRNEAGSRVQFAGIKLGDDAVETCLGVKKELEVLRNDENELLKKDFDKFASEIGVWSLHKRGGKRETDEAIL